MQKETQKRIKNYDCNSLARTLKTVNLSLQNALEAHGFVRLRGSHISYKIGSQMTVRLLTLCTDRPLTPGTFLVFIRVRG
jgi:predicted RNA binding protein YcfA (HicA-like mRNA interferase family)